MHGRLGALVFLGLAACGGDAAHHPKVSTTPDDSGTSPTKDPGTTTGSSSTTGSTSAGESVDEVFDYSAPPADVLFVIDSSSSMGTHVTSLVDALDGLVTTWTARNVDFHAGVVDIDESDVQGQLVAIQGMKWAEPATPAPGPGPLLQSLVDSVGDPSITEAGRETAYKALEMTDAGEPNDGFLRADSDLAVIVFTDSEDQSPTTPVTVQEFVDYLTGLRPDPALREFDSIVATDDYFDITTSVGGVSWNIDNTPYGPALDAITATVQGNNTFVLSTSAVESSLTAHVDEPDGSATDLANDALTWDDATLTVGLGDYFPQTGAVVTISYRPSTP